MTRVRTVVVAIGLSLLLAACFLVPGKFASTLDVKRDGDFTFAYKGEIVLLTPSSLGQAAGLPDPATMKCFGPVPGTVPPPVPPLPMDGKIHTAPASTRPCTADETAKRTADAAATRAREGEQMAKLIGMDPRNDAAMRDYAAQVAKQAGWRSVAYRGNGVFDVDFEQSGRLDRDFVFPLMPKATVILPFVVIRRRSDGAVLVTAPAYRSAPAQAFLSGLNSAQLPKPPVPPTEGPLGSFVVTSDLAPLTNNTDDGPTRIGARSRLRWTVAPGSDKIPEALIPTGR